MRHVCPRCGALDSGQFAVLAVCIASFVLIYSGQLLLALRNIVTCTVIQIGVWIVPERLPCATLSGSRAIHHTARPKQKFRIVVGKLSVSCVSGLDGMADRFQC